MAPERLVPDEREVLMQVAAAAAAASGLDELLEKTSEAACEAMGAASLSISRWERERAVMRTLINVGELGPDEQRWPEDEIYEQDTHPSVDRLLRTAQPYFNAIDDPEADPRAVALLRSLNKESDIGVPIVVEGEVWGEVWATTATGSPRFTGRDVRFLEAIAGQLGGVVARGEMFSRVSRLAYEDELTGLANRRALDEQLAAAIDRWREDGHALTLLACDVDELKAINDERGHHAGDRALRRVGQALVKAAASVPGATVARISGDEFAVVLDGADLNAAGQVGTTTLRILREGRDTTISVSCGVAAAGPGTERPELLMRAADAAQYAAKRRGGAQVCSAGVDDFHDMLAAGDGGPRRRGRRRSQAERTEEACGRMLELLDTTLAQRSALDRLEAVSSTLAQLVNASGWTVSFALRGDGVIRSLAAADGRDSLLRGMRVGLEDEVYSLDAYPATARLVEAGSGTFHVDRYDRSADEAERRLLDEIGYTGVLAAAASDSDGTYLIELYADGETRELAALPVSLSLLARAAAANSSGAVDTAQRLRRRTRHIAVTGAIASRLARARSEIEAVEAVVDELHAEYAWPLTGVARLTEDGVVESMAARGPMAEPLMATWRQSARLGLIGRALRERAPVVVGDVTAEPDYRLTDVTRTIRSEVCIPLWAGDRLWGVLDIEDDNPHAFGEEEVRLLRTAADQLCVALRALSTDAGAGRSLESTI
ncbi:MAG TPA: diguanylate cyclase [Thermoleophilaceae bacterium]|nr:diguanylate cyclase [Thermoleophilaceae bacterium]